MIDLLWLLSIVFSSIHVCTIKVYSQSESTFTCLELSNCSRLDVDSKVFLHGAPNVLNWIEVRARSRGAPPVDAFLLKIVLCPSTCVFWVIVLLESMTT